MASMYGPEEKQEIFCKTASKSKLTQAKLMLPPEAC
jgi:hypothetical protein